MNPFIVLGWSVDDAAAARAVQDFERTLLADGRWRARLRQPGLLAYGRDHGALRLRTLGPPRGLVLGALFEADGSDAPETLSIPPPRTARARAQGLIDRYWGRYAAVLCGPSGEIEGVLRDPSGALEVVTWCRSGVRVVTSDLEAALLDPLRPTLQVDWSMVGAYLTDFSRITGFTALQSVAAPAPGAYLGVGDDPVQLWRPERFARAVVDDVAAATRTLRERVEACVAAHARAGGRILAEVSGGLDSSIVAACLVRTGRGGLDWVHHGSGERGGDERRFVDILAKTLNLDVCDRPKRPFSIDPDAIGRSQTGVRPSFSALDPPYDAQMVEFGSARQVDSVFTGMAGDGLFFLSALPAIAVDMVRRRGPTALWSNDLSALARWTRRSVWRVGRQALLASLLRRTAPCALAPRWVASSPSHVDRPHPWLAGVADLPPAKRRHVEELVHALHFWGASARATAFDVVNPLFSQPVMEHCLRVPIDLLTQGGRDRALARAAFRDRLPRALVERRSKGELGAYYSRAFAEGLPALRAYLLDGRLVEQGLLLSPELEAALSEAHLAQFGDAGSVLRAVAVEGWVRRWNG